jgi:hypothetical protein
MANGFIGQVLSLLRYEVFFRPEGRSADGDQDGPLARARLQQQDGSWRGILPGSFFDLMGTFWRRMLTAA